MEGQQGMGANDNGRGARLRPLAADDAAAGVIARMRVVVDAIGDELAVSDDTREVSFAELATEAAAVRRALGERHEQGTPVAVLHPHTASAVATILGVIASGNPMIVLDARTPTPRLVQFVQRAGATTCVCAPEFAAQARDLGPDLTVLDVDTLPAGTLDDLWSAPADPAGPAVLAFTSGSTGVPKIVANDQRMLVIDAWDNSLATGCYDADDVVAHTLPMAFHAGLMVTVAGLVVGATMRLYDTRSRGIAALPAWIEQTGATIMHSSPAILRAFVGTKPSPDQLAGLRSVTVAGEAAHGRDVEQVRPLLAPSCVIRNRYGSSETGLIAEYAVDAAHPTLEGPLPVGRPAGHTRIDIVDDAGEPVAAGEPGLVRVTRDFIATGYWNNDEATAASFVDNPDGTRTFRASDLGRVDERGLTLLGRRDHSVKIRGYLVEPGEVDAALFALPEITEALTVGVPRDQSGQYRLVSYVVSMAERPSGAAVRAALREVLPGHLVPESVVFLPALPRTDRGKLDRSALPEPPAVVVGDPPITEWERLVAQVWARALGLEEVGRTADFFQLGGDSLVAEELTAMVVTDLGVDESDVSSRLLAEAPTLADYAGRLKRHPDRKQQIVTELRREGSKPPLFIVAGGGGLGVGFVPLVRHLPADQPVWALHSYSLERRGLPDWSVGAAARRNLAEVRRIQPHGPYHLAGHSFGGLIALEMAQRLRRDGEEVALLIELDSFPPDPAKQPVKPSRSLGRKVRDLAGLAVTGLVPTPGLGQFWRFHAQSQLLTQWYRTSAYPGRTLVVVADSEDRELRSAWEEYLSGPWNRVSTPGDHMSMLREPHAQTVAAIITDALAEVHGRPADAEPSRA